MPVNTPSESYKEHADDWRLIRDVIEGAKAVRAGGDKYLPKLTGMDYTEYAAYANRAQFFNATARTVNGLVGAVFRREPKIILGDGAESLRPLLDRCTVDNQSFLSFSRHIFRETLSIGRVGALVDAPANGGTPYFTSYPAESITNWRVVKMPDERVVADQVVLCEYRAVPAADGFGSDEEKYYRVLFLDNDGRYGQQIYVEQKSLDGRSQYALVGTTYPSLPGAGGFYNDMPFVCFNARGTGLKIEKSPILDIAELNKLHFQRSAQLAHGQFYTATPTYWAIAPVNNDDVTYRVGPNTVWLVDQPNGCGILEYRGEGLKYLESACNQLEQQMSGLGARLVSDRKNTAAEASDVAAMRDKGETSLLHEIVSAIDTGLTDLLKTWVRWQGRNPKDVSVRLNRDFVGAAIEYRTWLQLDRAHEKGDIDDETYYQVLFEGEMLPASFTPQDIPELIKKAEAKRAQIKREEEAAKMREIEAKRAKTSSDSSGDNSNDDDEDDSNS
jgi:hypothetical protein